jgi:hypothetical protein
MPMNPAADRTRHLARRSRAHRLQGAQLSLYETKPRSYRATTANGSLVACGTCLDLYRARVEPCALTGETLPVECCDLCSLREDL